MSRRSKTVFCCVAILGMAIAASAFLITRASTERLLVARANSSNVPDSASTYVRREKLSPRVAAPISTFTAGSKLPENSA